MDTLNDLPSRPGSSLSLGVLPARPKSSRVSLDSHMHDLELDLKPSQHRQKVERKGGSDRSLEESREISSIFPLRPRPPSSSRRSRPLSSCSFSTNSRPNSSNSRYSVGENNYPVPPSQTPEPVRQRKIGLCRRKSRSFNSVDGKSVLEYIWHG